MFKTEAEVMEHQAHLWCMARQALIDAGCPLEDGCHVPTVHGNWLNGVTALRTFTAQGTRGFDAADVARQLDAAATKGDSSLHEVAAIVIRRLLSEHVAYIADRPIVEK